MKRSNHRGLSLLVVSSVALSSALMPAFNARALEINGSGTSGQDGSRAWSGNDASRSTPGTDGEPVNITIKDVDQGTRAIMQVVGTVGSRSVRDAVELSPHVSLLLRSQGGRGGNGGRGGDGRDGRTGSSGRDATKYSDATDGGRGGDGEDGGDGTPGSNGGNGGKIVVHLPVEDLHLSMLVDYNVSGGRGGDPGYNGRGGDGGQGGSGGSGYSWSEKTGERCAPDRFQDNGNGSSTVVKGDCTPTYSHHSRSSGSRGPRGSDGRPGSGNISGGRNGQDGNFQFVVTGPGGTTTYRRAIDLRLASFTFRELNPNGVFEPGEQVEISDLRVQNLSEMPWTTGKAKALLTLGSSQWIIAEPLEIEIPALAGGSSVTLPKNFRFRIRDNSLPVGEQRLAVSESVVPWGRITRIEKTPQGLRLPKALTISYPVEISPLQTKKNAVSPGETVEVSWVVKNLSRNPIGANSAEARALTTAISQWRPADEDLPGSIHFNGQSLDSSFTQSVALLQPGASFVVKGQLAFSKDHLPYTNVQVQTGLSLKTLEGDGKVRDIQLRRFQFSISQTFAGHKDSDWLIITNSGTKRDEYLAWLALAKRIGAKVDVWDLSYEGALSLFQNLKNGSNVADLYRGKTIIVLNNLFKTENQSLIEPRSLMEGREVLRSLSERGVRFYYLGGGSPQSATQEASLIDEVLLGRAGSGQSEQTFDDFEKSIEAMPESEKPELQFKIRIEEKSFGKPSPKLFAERVQDIRTILGKKFPIAKIAIHASARSITKTESSALRSTYFLGYVRVSSGLTPESTGQMVWLPRNASESQDPKFVAGEENLIALTLASPANIKLRLLDAYVNQSQNNQLSGLADALIAATTLEIAELAEQQTKLGVESAVLKDILTLIAKSESSGLKKFVLPVLAARFEFYASNGTKQKLESASKNLTAAAVRDPEAKRVFETELERLEDEWKKRRKVLVHASKADVAKRMLFLPAISRASRSNHLLSQDLLDGGAR